MRPPALRLALLVALAGLPAEGRGQGVSHVGGDVDLVIPFTAGAFGTAVDTSTRLTWEAPAKPPNTGETQVGAQDCRLTVEATAVVSGDPAGPIPLMAGMPPRDVVTNIKKRKKNPRAPGSAWLRDEASVAAGPPPPSGMDLHTVVFPSTAQ